MLKGLLGAALTVAFAVGPAAEQPPPVTGRDFSSVHSYQPAWSPDGSRLAVLRTRPNQIVVMNADRSHPVPVGVGSAPAWSPDGKSIAYLEADANATRYLAIARADGAGSRRLFRVEASGSDDRPAWSTDGRLIAFHTGVDISVVRPDGTGLRRLIRGAGYPDWSPDGKKLVFTTRGGGDAGHVEVANADGTGRRRLQAVEPRGAAAPRWSPDGRRIAFDSTNESSESAVYVMDADGTNARPITPAQGFYDPSWRPASDELAVASTAGEISIAKLDGSPPVRFTYGGCTVVGTDGADRLSGGPGNDVICAFAGDDTADGGKGDDRLVGGTGDDRLAGGEGRDVLLGEDGADAIDAGRGRDSVLGGNGADTIGTRDGDPDFVDGGDGADTATSDRRDCLVLVERGSGGVRGCTGTPTFEATLDPAWSPDGKRIAFVDRRGFLGSLFVMNADGTRKHRVIEGWFDASWPSWSPDGRRIAFHHRRGTPSRPAGTYVVDVDGTGLRRVVTGGFQPAWSPRGKRIAFTKGGYQNSIFTVSPDGRDVRLVAKPPYGEPGEGGTEYCNSYLAPTWSPDGERVAFSVTAAGGECGFEVYIGASRGYGAKTTVLAGGWYDDPHWSPAGGAIAVSVFSPSGESEPQIAVVTLHNHRLRPLGVGSHPRWSPDARRIAFVRGDYGPGTKPRIYVTDADGTHLRQLTP